MHKLCFGFAVIRVGYDECRAVAKQVLLPVRNAMRVLWLNPGERYTSVVSPAWVKSEDNQIAVAQKVCWRLTYTEPREVDRSLVEGRHKPIGAWKLKMELGVVVHVQKHPLCSEKHLFSNGLILIKLRPGHEYLVSSDNIFCLRGLLEFSCKQTKVMYSYSM